MVLIGLGAWRCNLVMNTEKVKAASLKQSCFIGLHAVEKALIMHFFSACVSLSCSVPFCSFVGHCVLACLILLMTAH